MRQILFGAVFSLWASLLVADEMDFSASLSLKSKYLGKLGTTVDDHAVLQPYLELSHSNGLFVSLWINLPLEQGNPQRSLEVEPTVGYRKPLADWKLEAFITLTDLQNPRVFDFRGDVLSTNLKLSNRLFVIETIHYSADGGNEGVLGRLGLKHRLKNGISLSADAYYADGPFHFAPITYTKFRVQAPVAQTAFTLFVEVLEILDKTRANEGRRDQVAIGASYLF